MNPRFNAVDSPNSVIILAQSAIAVTSPADATEDIFAALSVPGGIMGINGALRLTTLWSFTNSVNSKTMRARFGGLTGTQYMSIALTTNDSLHHVCMVRNRGAANSQVGANGGGLSGNGGFGAGAAVLTSAVNTALDTSFVLTGQKATAGETLTLEAYLLELLLPQ